MRSTLRLEGTTLEWLPRPGASPERRRLTDEDHHFLDAWTDRYRRVLESPIPRPDDLAALGLEMYGWLDGGDSWLRRAREAGVTPPWIVDFVVPVQPDPLETAFLEAPWELLSDGGGPLAGNRSLVFCPIRRVGRPDTEEPPSSDRLFGVFMTALPEGVSDLGVEEEETSILDATAGVGMDLIVEDSGDLDRLDALLGSLDRVDIVHLSCHGALEPAPVLLLEDELGGPSPVGADQIQAALQPHNPRLLFLSACETAGSNRLLGALAPTLVQRGLSALLGWGGSVRDNQATRFTAELYQRLSGRKRLDESTAWARLELLSKPPGPAGDWHLARLFASPTGGGALASGNRKRRVRDLRQATKKTFLDARGEVPVASPEEFVGRRRDLQRILRVYRDGGLGVLLHGIGRQGKSSLALRILQRTPDHRPVVLYGVFDGGALLDAMAEAIAEPEARTLINERREEVQKSEDILTDVLVRLLEDYCAQTGERHKPLFFVLDDFEQLLEKDTAPPRRLVTRSVEPVRALFRALERADTESKILITSRYTFTLPWQRRDLAEDLVDHPLPRMSDSDRRKQLRTKLRALEVDTKDLDASLLPRLLKASQGNPGLQDLLTVLLLKAPERAERAISEMEAHIAGEKTLDQKELVAFLSNLALENLIALLSPSERDLLRISTLFSIPVPEMVMAKLARDAGLSPDFDRLIGLGLWEVYSPDSEASLLISGLARPDMEPLREEERREHAARIVEPLFETWGGKAGGSSRPAAQDLEITRLAFLAGAGEIVAVCAEDAITALERRLLNRDAADLGRKAIALLDKKGVALPLGLLRKTAEICMLIGDTATARELYGRAKEAMADVQSEKHSLDAADRAAVLTSHARLLVQDGEIEEALKGFEGARDLFSQSGRAREIAVTLGEIARIKRSRGEVDEALKLHEEQLRVYENLGDARFRAVALGDIARIKRSRGEVDEALKLHEEELRVYEALGDARSRAITLSDIARIKHSRGEADEALKLHEKILRVVEELGDAQGRAITLGNIARIKHSRGEVDEALKLHEERQRVFEVLGDARSHAVTLGDIARIKVSRGEVDEALKLHEERLRVFEALGDLDGTANTLWGIAQIYLSKDDFQNAFESLAEAYRINLELRRLDGICFVGWDLGQLLCAEGAITEGRGVLERSLAGFRHLRQDAMAQEIEKFLATLPPASEDQESPPTEQV